MGSNIVVIGYNDLRTVFPELVLFQVGVPLLAEDETMYKVFLVDICIQYSIASQLGT